MWLKLNHVSLLILCDEIGSIHNSFLLYIKVWWLSWRKALRLSCKWTSSFLHGTHLYLKEHLTTDQVYSCLDNLADIFLEMNEANLSFQWQLLMIFVLVIKFKLSRENWNWKTCNYSMSSTASQRLKTFFSDEWF